MHQSIVLCLDDAVFLKSSSNTGSYNLSISFFMDPGTLRGGMDGDAPFRIDGYKVSHSLSSRYGCLC